MQLASLPPHLLRMLWAVCLLLPTTWHPCTRLASLFTPHPCLGTTDAHCADAPFCPQQRKAHVTSPFSIPFEGPGYKQRAVRVWCIHAVLVQNTSTLGSQCQGIFSKYLTEALMEASHSHLIREASSFQSKGCSFFLGCSFT